MKIILILLFTLTLPVFAIPQNVVEGDSVADSYKRLTKKAKMLNFTGEISFKDGGSKTTISCVPIGDDSTSQRNGLSDYISEGVKAGNGNVITLNRVFKCKTVSDSFIWIGFVAVNSFDEVQMLVYYPNTTFPATAVVKQLSFNTIVATSNGSEQFKWEFEMLGGDSFLPLAF